jgi:hypothetical protein
MGRESRIEVELRTPGAPEYAAIVSFVGAHDVASANEIGDALASVDGDILVDLSDCTFIDSAVVAAVLVRARNLKRDGYRLELVLPPGNSVLSRVVGEVLAKEPLVVYPERPR